MFFEGTEVYDLNPPLTIESPLEDRIRLLIRGTFLFFSYTQLTRREDVTFFVWIINMNEHKNEFHVCACVYVHVSVENKDRYIPLRAERGAIFLYRAKPLPRLIPFLWKSVRRC